MLFPTFPSVQRGMRSRRDGKRRGAPAVLFLDYDPILPGWPAPDGAIEGDPLSKIAGGNDAAEKGVRTCATRTDSRS